MSTTAKKVPAKKAPASKKDADAGIDKEKYPDPPTIHGESTSTDSTNAADAVNDAADDAFPSKPSKDNRPVGNPENVQGADSYPSSGGGGGAVLASQNQNENPDNQGDPDKLNDDPAGRTAEQEVADRTIDNLDDEATVFKKSYLAGAPRHSDPVLPGTGANDKSGFDHAPNAQQMVQEAINLGLRIVGDIKYVGGEIEDYGYGNKAIRLDYEAPAIPAHLVGAGPTEVLSDQLATIDEVTSPSDLGDTGAPA